MTVEEKIQKLAKAVAMLQNAVATMGGHKELMKQIDEIVSEVLAE